MVLAQTRKTRNNEDEEDEEEEEDEDDAHAGVDRTFRRVGNRPTF